MNERRYLQLDVFADRPGTGNPLAVVVDAEGLDDAAMQAFAQWTNLSETIFLLPPGNGADYRVRIFTPRQELPFAGHPSVGAAWAAIDAGIADSSRSALVQDCAAGLLPVCVDERRAISVRAPRARCIEASMADGSVAGALAGARAGDLAPALWDNGPRWWIAELATEADVHGMRPDMAAITALTRDAAVGFAVFAAADASSPFDLVVRAFCPADGIPEDPVTGSANAVIAAALADAGRLPGRDGRYVASQGREVGRDGRVVVRFDEQGEVWIGGHVLAVIRGSVAW